MNILNIRPDDIIIVHVDCDAHAPPGVKEARVKRFEEFWESATGLSNKTLFTVGKNLNNGIDITILRKEE